MPPERQPGLEPQRVAGAKSGKADVFIGDKPFGQCLRRFDRHGNLEPVLACVAGAGDDAGDAGNVEMAHLHEEEAVEIDAEPGQHIRCGRSLKGEKGAFVAHRHVHAARQIRLEMGNVVVGAAGIHHQLQHAVETRDHQIVEHTAGLVQEHGIAHPPLGDAGDVCRCQCLDHGIGIVTRQPDLGHVRHVEQAGGIAGGQMFGLDPVGILDRHVPAGERHHARTMRDVEICQYGFVKRGIGLHGVSPVQTRQKGIRIVQIGLSECALSVVEPERFPALRPSRTHDQAAFPVGGHSRATFQSAHNVEYGYLRVSRAVAPSVATASRSRSALPHTVSSPVMVCIVTPMCKVKCLTSA